MAYKKIRKKYNLDTKTRNRLATIQDILDISNEIPDFYEFEPAVVLDVILDTTHPIFKDKSTTPYVNPLDIPSDVKPKENTIDETWVGRIKFKLLDSQRAASPQELTNWAIPLDDTIDYPLINEVVVIVKHDPISGAYFYTNKLNIRNLINNNADFNLQTSDNTLKDVIAKTINPNNSGPTAKMYFGDPNGGVLGSYFTANNKIKKLVRKEGDKVIESRFGSSIRFGAYTGNSTIDKGDPRYNSYLISNGYGGNPYILIRNRQQALSSIEKSQPAGGHIEENVNADGSSIHLTSGTHLTSFKSTVLQSVFDIVSMEDYVFPALNGDQIVINSDRLIFSAKNNEMFCFSKKRFSIATDSDFTVDTPTNITLTSEKQHHIISPYTRIGPLDEAAEPAVLGDKLVIWLDSLCEWLKKHTHRYKHIHPKTKDADPEITQFSIEIEQLTVLQSQLKSLLSYRVFVVGGNPNNP